MEKEQRNQLARAVVDARFLLEDEFEDQLEGLFNILPDGKVLGEGPGDPVVRGKLLELMDYYEAGGAKPKEAVARMTREMAFTTLNRFVALKLCERRGVVRECVSQGINSEGLRELAGCAPGLRQASADEGYRLLLEAICDEISLGLKVLFDRRSPTGLLWPRPHVLDQLLATLNADELESVWDEDETIGWVYQYFNADDVEKMRKASSAPRNSRELAVRNQFFTPRYVVEFLTDNTLGRTWFEMRKGDTSLKETCEYLVYTPGEVFLSQGEEPPPEPDTSGLSQEELLKLPSYVRYRPRKDPRDLRILDPAVGSGHFLLYAFGLLETIYEEAWADSGMPTSESTGGTLREDFPAIDSLREQLPELILRHNLFGIEIDPRCAQIASLALWLRAQKAWDSLGIAASARPPIDLTNIVVAEPMPGDAAQVEAFAGQLEPRVLADLFAAMVHEMRLAGELGSLLKVEQSLKDELGNLVNERAQLELGSESVGEEILWGNAEEVLLTSLRSFAAAAEEAVTARRLFAGDASQGVALLDMVRRRFDVVLMNPPFGDCSAPGKKRFGELYPRTKNDIYAAFVERGLELLHTHGLLGAITSRTGFFLSSFQRWREEIILSESRPTVYADLGYGAMDSAMVEAAAYCLESM